MKKNVKINGMHCEKCVARVKKALEKLGGKEVSVTLNPGEATGDFPEKVTDLLLREAIEDLGFEVAE